MKREDVIIIGGGPAGMISAIQLKRYGVAARLFEPNRLGGLLWNANLVENYPGFPGGVPGPQLVSLFVQQFQDLSLEATAERVIEIDYQEERFVVKTGAGEYLSETLMIASGTRPRTFPAGFIPPDASERVFYEVAPLLEVRGKRIAIIGAGDAAFDYALNLSRSNKVIILNRTQEIKALPLLVERCAKIQELEVYQDTPVASVETGAGGLVLKSGQETRKDFMVDVLIGAIGRVENLPPMSDRLQAQAVVLQQAGRLHIIGDVRNGIYRQTAIAVGDGLKAAMKVYQFLKEQKPV